MRRVATTLVSVAMVGVIVGAARGQERNFGTEPDLDHLQEVIRPPSIAGLAFDGKEIWGLIYHGRGRYVLLDGDTESWRSAGTAEHHAAIAEAAGAYSSPGGACISGEMLWIAGSYGDSIACIDTKRWRVVRSFRGKQRDAGSQAYNGIAHDGKHLWVAWNLGNYDLPATDTHRLLKMNAETGEVLASYPLPAGNRADGAEGLAWDGARLWHAKGATLSCINPSDGTVTAQYPLRGVRRPSGLVWTDDALVIAEFSGTVWLLPFMAE